MSLSTFIFPTYILYNVNIFRRPRMAARVPLGPGLVSVVWVLQHVQSG